MITRQDENQLNFHKILLIKLQQMELRAGCHIQDDQFVYYSFSAGQKMYFSSRMHQNVTNLSDDIILPLNSANIPEIIELQRWQNHMILFNHQLDLSQLKTRLSTKKKIETKTGEILTLTITILNDEQIKFGNKHITSITQHYLLISSFTLKNQNKTIIRDDPGPSYFLLSTSQNSHIVPVINGEVCVKLPEKFKFRYYRNGKLAGQSKKYQTMEFSSNVFDVELQGINGNKNNMLNIQLKWGINLSEAKVENTLLIQSHQLYIYDYEIKFDNYNEYNNSKVKVVYGNKMFQIATQFPSPKAVKVKKIAHFIIKSEDEEINIVVERNMKIVAQARLYTDQIVSYTVNSLKKKIVDQHGKNVGNIKFKCEKAKNLSTISNNKFWKESQKKKIGNMVLLSIEQLSVNYQEEEPVSVIVKTENQERILTNVPNFQYFNKEQEISYVPIVVNSKPEDSVYLMVKEMNKKQNRANLDHQESYQNSTDFIGIAVLNFSELRLGMNSVEIPFYKNQIKTITANCLINKVTSFPFIKSIFQPQMLLSHTHKTLSLSIFMKKVKFTPFFYTFRYQNKNQVYCIVEANRMKKVLIMESVDHNDLTFISSSSSDSLNFIIEDSQYIKIKITFLVSDIGHQQQIYGFTVIKIKAQQLSASGDIGLIFKDNEIKNNFGTVIGIINIQIYKGVEENNDKSLYDKDDIDVLETPRKNYLRQRTHQKQVTSVRIQKKNDFEEINHTKQVNPIKNIINNQREKNYHHQQVNPIRNHIKRHSIQYTKPTVNFNKNIRYGQQRKSKSISTSLNQSINLPSINNNKSKGMKSEANTLKELIQMMKIRKRSTKGTYQENSTMKSYSLREAVTQKQRKSEVDRQLQSLNNNLNSSAINISREKIQRENPNLQRNLQILFPKKMHKNQKKEHLQRQIDEYQQKLKGLKSVYEEISQDIQEIQPSLKNQPTHRHPNQNKKFEDPELQDNQFSHRH